MKQRFVTTVDKTVWNGQEQINALIGVDEDNQKFSVTNAQASRDIRMEQFHYFLWDGKDKAIQLMSVANYVEPMEYDETLNFHTI
jgi:hypothetical protein